MQHLPVRVLRGGLQRQRLQRFALPQDGIGGDAGGDGDLVGEESPAAPGAGDDAGGCGCGCGGALSVGVVGEGGAHAAPCCARSCLAASSSWPA